MPSRIGPKKGEGDAAAEDEPPASPSLAKRLTSRISTKAMVPPSYRFTETVSTGEWFTADSVTLTLDTTGQHTLSWDIELTLKASPTVVLPPGACNLYLFPAVDGKPVSDRPLAVLNQLLLAIVLDKACTFFDRSDEVGAFPIHAITVANTDDAVALSGELVTARPSLLTQVHVNHRAGFPLFAGESCLHICAVNVREALFCKMIDLTVSQLPKEQAVALYESQAAGVFFDELPMRFYGGSPLAYACCFQLRRPVQKMLETGFIDINDRSQSCKISGFLPIHAVVSNGLMDTYDWLTEKLPESIRVDATQRSAVGRQVGLNVHGLLPAQLASWLGDHASVKHILKKQVSILWIWGPVTQYSMNLRGIDSAGEGGGDIMELVARQDASKRTRELLLDSFMLGFVHSLFVQKWKLFGARLHYVRLFLDVALLLMVIFLAFWLKETPAEQAKMVPLAVVMLVIMAILVEEEVRTTYLWWQNNQGEGDAKVSTAMMIRGSMRFMKSHAVNLLFVS